MQIWHRNYKCKDKRTDEAETERERPSQDIIHGTAEAGFEADLSI